MGGLEELWLLGGGTLGAAVGIENVESGGGTLGVAVGITPEAAVGGTLGVEGMMWES